MFQAVQDPPAAQLAVDAVVFLSLVSDAVVFPGLDVDPFQSVPDVVSRTSPAATIVASQAQLNLQHLKVFHDLAAFLMRHPRSTNYNQIPELLNCYKRPWLCFVEAKNRPIAELSL